MIALPARDAIGASQPFARSTGRVDTVIRAYFHRGRGGEQAHAHLFFQTIRFIVALIAMFGLIECSLFSPAVLDQIVSFPP